MKRLLLALFLLTGAQAQAQSIPTYDLQFTTAVRQDTLAVRIQIRLQSGSAEMGLSNFVLNFDSLDISFPDNPVKNQDYRFLGFDSAFSSAYGEGSVTRNPGALVSLNVAPNFNNTLAQNGNGAAAATTITTQFTDVGEIYFHILDPQALSTLAWDTTNTIVNSSPLGQTWTQGNLVDATSVVLPVELSTFEAVADGGVIALTWSTASETNNAGFEVQYAAADSAVFRSAGFREGEGTTSEKQSYAFSFKPPVPGSYKVRLKQVDFDGASTFSPEISVVLTELLTDADGHPVAYVFGEPAPNPFSHTTAAQLLVSKAQHVEVALYNVVGSRVATLFRGTLPASTAKRLTIDGSGLPSGVYFMRVEGETFSESRQVVLVK